MLIIIVMLLITFSLYQALVAGPLHFFNAQGMEIFLSTSVGELVMFTFLIGVGVALRHYRTKVGGKKARLLCTVGYNVLVSVALVGVFGLLMTHLELFNQAVYGINY